MKSQDINNTNTCNTASYDNLINFAKGSAYCALGLMDAACSCYLIWNNSKLHTQEEFSYAEMTKRSNGIPPCYGRTCPEKYIEYQSAFRDLIALGAIGLLKGSFDSFKVAHSYFAQIKL